MSWRARTASGLSPPRRVSTEMTLAPDRGPRRTPSIQYTFPADDEDLAFRFPPPPRRHSHPGEPPLPVRRESSQRDLERKKYPLLCYCIIALNVAVFVFEIYSNDWQLQPFSCPAVCYGGAPCLEDGSPCEANPMLGPTVAVLDRLGAKNDIAIFERGEWWRVITCNWLHAGIIHAAMNMGAIMCVPGRRPPAAAPAPSLAPRPLSHSLSLRRSIGKELECAFGAWRIGLLYFFAGIFGTLISMIFLPGTISVGASASVFGLLGANWADVVVNFCARCTLRGSGVVCLGVITLFNVAIGFTPFVDNFMHLGGLLAGVVIGMALFAQKTERDPRTGRRVRTWGQELVVLVATLLILAMGVAAVASVASEDLQVLLRACPFCEHINCFPIGKVAPSLNWWSCCQMSLEGACLAIHPPPNASAPIVATCNMTGAAAPYEASCTPSENSDCVWPPDMGPADPRLGTLCQIICSGC